MSQDIPGSGSHAGRTSALLLGTMAVAMLILLAVEAGRALGFGDEGIYLMGPRYPDEVMQNVSTIFRFSGYVFSLVGHNPIYFRLACVGLVVVSALVLAAGVAAIRPWFAGQQELTPWQRLQVPLFLIVGSLLHYQWSYLTPSYYTLTAMAVNTLTGLTLLSVVSLGGNNRRYMGWGLLYGFFFGIVLFAKFPTALPMLAMTSMTVAICARPQQSLAFAACVLAGFSTWLLLTFTTERSPAQALRDFMDGWSIYQSLGYHNPADKLIAYPTEVGVLLLTSAVWFLPSFLLLGAAGADLLSRGPLKELGRWPALAALAIGLAAIMSLPSGILVDVADRLVTTPYLGMTRFYIAAQLAWVLLLAGLVFVAYRSDILRLGWSRWIVLLFLLGAPLAGSLGTSNPIYNVIQFYAGPWFALILALLWLLWRDRFVSYRLVQFTCLLVCAYTTSQVIQGSWTQPAQIKPRSMASQDQPTMVGYPPVSVLLDVDTSRLIEDLRAAATESGFQPGDDIIGFNQIAGLVYALGGKSPGHPVFPCCRPAENAYGAAVLRFADRERLKHAYILLDVPPEPDVENLLRGAGLQFPEEYELVTTSVGLSRQFRLYRPSILSTASTGEAAKPTMASPSSTSIQ